MSYLLFFFSSPKRKFLFAPEHTMPSPPIFSPFIYAVHINFHTWDFCTPFWFKNSLVLVHGFSFSISFFPLIVDFTLIGEQVCKLCSFIFFWNAISVYLLSFSMEAEFEELFLHDCILFFEHFSFSVQIFLPWLAFFIY